MSQTQGLKELRRETDFRKLFFNINDWIGSDLTQFKAHQKEKKGYNKHRKRSKHNVNIIKGNIVRKEAILKVENLSKSFYSDFWKPKISVLNGVSFEVLEGESVGFLGANGAGKTTTLKTILGLITQDSGSISFSSKLGTKKSEIFDSIGYLPERPYFYPHLTGRQYCHFISKLGCKVEKFETKLETLAADFSIVHALDKKLSSYSKGMLQRIGLVSCLLHDPKLVFLDEPMSGLDPIGRREIREAIGKLKANGVTVFFSTHIVHDIEEICDSVVVLKDGQCLFNGPIENLLGAAHDNTIVISYLLEKELHKKAVSEDSLNNELSLLISSGALIKSVLSEFPKLEDVIYKIQGLEK